MIVATVSKELLSKLVDTSITLLRVKAEPGRINIATFLVAALHLAVLVVVLTNAIRVAVAAPVASAAGRHAQMRSIGLGSVDDGSSHVIDGLLDGDLLVELLKVLISGLVHEDTLGGHKRNLEGGDSISDLDGSSLNSGGGVEEVGKSDTLHPLVTVLAGLTVALDVLLDVVELILEGVTSLGVHLSIVDPEVRVDISDVGTDCVIPVEGKAALTNRGGSGDVHVVGKDELVEDRASEASLDVDNEVLEHLLAVHGVDGGLHLGAVEVAATREADSTLRTVIVEENKNVVIRARLEALATADATHILTSKDLDEVLAGNKVASVILGNTLVHIRAVGLVDDLTGLGILIVVSNIILHHNNDALIRNTHLVDNLIGVANISLVTIVVVTVTASSKNNPGLGGKLLLRKVRKRIGTHCNSSKSKKSKNKSVHL